MKRLLIVAALCALSLTVAAKKPAKQEPKPQAAYTFTDIVSIPSTPVKDQASSGTCWSFSGIGLVENELLRQGKGEFDLSEMWIVRHTYFQKALKYARMHGQANLGGGGATHDVFNMIDQYGIVPEEAYTGLHYGTDEHIHGELDQVIKAYMDAVIANKNRSLSTAWQDGLNGILDAYLGKLPEKFTYQGKEYTPRQFADMLGIKGSDYKSYTSFTHHPFGVAFAIEVPDNWANGLSMNVPIDQMMAIIDSTLENGGSVLWAADVSEKGFEYNKGFAVLAELDLKNMDDSEKAKWSVLTEAERKKEMLKFDAPVKEQKVTQESRQKGFDNYTTTDDHGMVITGIAKDQNGNKFYRVKNSWAAENAQKGYFYASEPFVRAKTMNIVVFDGK